MEDYLHPDEEYELLYEEEMEAMRQLEEETEQCNSRSRRSKNSLNFDSVDLAVSKSIEDSKSTNSSNSGNIQNNRKRRQSSESLSDLTSDLEVVERPSKKHKNCDYEFRTESKNHEHGITSIRIPKWAFMPVSTEIGEKLYVKLNGGVLSSNVMKNYSYSYSSSGLLVTPYSKLKTLAEEILQKNKQAENSIGSVDATVEQSDLWVEKYKPKSYFDLLSDEAVNRTLLNWLKMWDKVVFNKEVKIKNINEKVMRDELDNDGRPHYKIALLCGPPGLGKTTLAHIAAQIAGYNVIEVNASDDRSIEAFNSKLEAATKMKSVIGSQKPHCLVLDEIDGAPAPTIDFLLKYLSGKNSEKHKKGKKEKPAAAVKRPVICICNELYAPSLRQLRQQAFVVHFPSTSSTKLAQRLLEICKKQNIKTDLSTLTLLCDKAQNDIRSCISTLYFFKNKSGDRFKSSDVIKSEVGQKDIQKGLFNMWREIFQIPIKRGAFFKNAVNKVKEDEVSSHINYSKKQMDKVQYIVQMLQSTGDYDKLVQGVFENFPKSKYIASANSLTGALEWFTWFDLLDSNIKKEQSYVLMPYLPYSFVAWHFLLSTNSFWKISYPNAGYENFLKETRCKQILQDVLRGLNASVRPFNQSGALLLDVLPMFNTILVPSIRSVNPTLFNEREKKDFKELIDTMIEYNLNFIQQRSTDGTYSFQYDPNIDELSRFNVSQASVRSFTYNMKQIISHEIELEKLRRVEESQKVNETSSEEDKSKDKTQPNPVPEIQPKKLKIQENEGQYKDFFGRVIKIKETSADKCKFSNCKLRRCFALLYNQVQELHSEIEFKIWKLESTDYNKPPKIIIKYLLYSL